MKNNMYITIEGKEGLFHVKKSVTLYWEYETKKSLNDNIRAIVSELTKMGKKSGFTMDIIESINYVHFDKKRYILRGESLDIRTFNGVDYSQSTIYTFVSQSDAIKYLRKELKEYAHAILGDVPDDISYFAKKIRNEKEVM